MAMLLLQYILCSDPGINKPVLSLHTPPAGMFLASLALHMASTAERLMPEPLLFAASLLRTFRHQRSPAESLGPRGWSLPLAPPSGDTPLPAAQPLYFALAGNPAVAGGESGGPSLEAFSASCVSAAVGLIGRAADVYAGVPSFPELFEGPLAELRELEGLGSESLSEVRPPDDCSVGGAFIGSFSRLLKPSLWQMGCDWNLLTC